MFSIFETEKSTQKTSSLLYDDREIVVTAELLPSSNSENKKIKISTYDNSNKEDVLNVTYFLAIENYPGLQSMFPTFAHYIIITVGIGVPLLVLVGYFHCEVTKIQAKNE